MNCPRCGYKLSPKQIAKEFAAIGGSANTPAQNKARAQNAKLGGWPKGRKRKTRSKTRKKEIEHNGDKYESLPMERIIAAAKALGIEP